LLIEIVSQALLPVCDPFILLLKQARNIFKQIFHVWMPGIGVGYLCA
jgi:hypothetical protein